MRIITGSARGYRLETLNGAETRPTTDRVKEGVFSTIQFEIEGRQVIDLFAGSGQMGLEALSRGAAGCVFVDKNVEAVSVIRRNLNGMSRGNAGLQKNAKILNIDALNYLIRSEDKFDLAFIDPPYASGLATKALTAVVSHMNPGGVIICESNDDTDLPNEVGEYKLSRLYKYGNVGIRLYRFSGGKQSREVNL